MHERKAKKQTSRIIRQARLEKGYAQQSTAIRASITIRAYQRLEYGERDIADASMRVGLSVCSVLGLDPFVLVLGDDAETLKKKIFKTRPDGR